METKIFESPQFGQIRTSGTSEEPLFCLADVCKVLELQPSRVRDRLNEGGVTSSKVGVQTGTKKDGTPAIQQIPMLFINEQNLYKVIMRSDKPQAEAFQDWVCGEVLPAIRKSGGYMNAQAGETPEQLMARALKVADEALKRAEQKSQILESTVEAQEQEIKRIAPMAEYTHEVLQSTTTYTLTQVSKDLNFRSIYKFTDWAKQNKILYKQSGQWLPYSQYSEMNYFSTRTSKFVKSDGTVGTSLSTVVTERGRAWLHLLLKKNENSINK